MADAKLEIKVGVDVDPAKKALKEVDGAINKTAANAKVAGSKIDEAFKAASGKVQESIGPLGKLLGPAALGLGAVALAFQRVATSGAAAAREVVKFQEASGLSASKIESLTKTLAGFEAAQNRSAGAWARMTEGVVRFYAEVSSGASDLANAIMDANEAGNMARESFNRGNIRRSAGQAEAPQYRSGASEAVENWLREKLGFWHPDTWDQPSPSLEPGGVTRNSPRFRMTMTPSTPTPKTPQELNEERRREAERARREFEASLAGSSPTWSDWVAIQEDRRRNEVQRSAWGVEYQDMISAYHARRREENLARQTSIQAGFESRQAGPSFLDQYGGAIGGGIGGVLSGGISGGNVGSAIASSVGGIATMAATSLLGPLAGGIVGGVIDGFVSLISGAFGENPEDRARREAREAARKQWMRDTAARRRNALPEFDPFLGARNRATVVNVNFNGPVGSPGRIARQLSDAMGG